MSKTLTLNPLNTVVAHEPISDIREQQKFLVVDGPGDHSFQRIAHSSSSNTGFSWKVDPPSRSSITSRLIRVQVPIRITVTGTVSGGNILDEWAESISLRAYPLNNVCFNSVSLQIDQASTTQSSADVFEALMRYQNADQANSAYSATPSMLDQSQNYSTYRGSNRSELAGYGNTSEGLYNQEPRGAFSNYTIITNNATTGVIDVYLEEYLYLSPLLFGGYDQTGIFGASSIQININNNQNLSRILSVIVGGSTNIATISQIAVNISDPSCVYGSTSYALMNYYNVRENVSLPKDYSWDYYQQQVQNTMGGSLLASASTTLTSTSQQINTIPNRIYVFLRRRDADRTAETSDVYARIDQLSINFNGRDNLLSNMRTHELYQMSRQNGLQLSFNQWNKEVGSVIAIDPAKDLGLRAGETPGVRNQNYQLQITVQYTNINSATVNFDLYVVSMLPGLLQLNDGYFNYSTGVVSPINLLINQDLQHLDYDEYRRNRTMYGGKSFWNKITDVGKKVYSGAKKGVQAVNKAVHSDMGKKILDVGEDVLRTFAPRSASAIDAVKKYGPSVLKTAENLLGSGMCQDHDEAIMMASDLHGSGLIGGKMLPKQALKKRLIKY
jgi:hypothetical protein